MADIREIWDAACSRLQDILTEDTYQRWIAYITPVRLEGEHLVLGVPSDVFVDWLIRNYKELIEDVIKKVQGVRYKILFEGGHEIAPVQADVEEKASQAEEEIRHKPGKVASESTFGLDRRYTFDTFVIGENNRMAMAACQAVADKPGESVNPLFIIPPRPAM